MGRVSEHAALLVGWEAGTRVPFVKLTCGSLSKELRWSVGSDIGGSVLMGRGTDGEKEKECKEDEDDRALMVVSL